METLAESCPTDTALLHSPIKFPGIRSPIPPHTRFPSETRANGKCSSRSIRNKLISPVPIWSITMYFFPHTAFTYWSVVRIQELSNSKSCRVYLLYRPSARQLSRNVPASAGFLCYKLSLLKDKIKETMLPKCAVYILTEYRIAFNS